MDVGGCECVGGIAWVKVGVCVIALNDSITMCMCVGGCGCNCVSVWV